MIESGRAWLLGFGREFRLAARSLWQARAFSVVTVVSLACGFALATTTLAITSAYLIRSLPYPDAKRLYHVRYAPPGPYEPRGMTALDWEALSDVVDATIVSAGDSVYLGDPGDAGALQFVRATRVSPGFITGLGVRPVIGPSFSEADFKTGASPVALMGHALWRERFNADPDVIGREIRVMPENQRDAARLIRIVGVLPAGFWFGRASDARVDLLMPMQTRARVYMVRLREGMSVAVAEQRITAAASLVGSDFRPDWTGVQLQSVHDRYVEGLRPLLFGINGATGLVLILVCANVAILVLLRTLRRQRDMAVRVALGADRRHVLRLLAAEASLVCAGALLPGVGLTALALRMLAPVIEERLGRPPPAGPAAITIDASVVWMIGGVGLLVVLALAFVPLWAPHSHRLAEAMRRGGLATTDGPAMRRLRSTLIALEIAGAFVLLVGGGLMLRTVLNLLRTDLGFNAAHIARVGVVLPGSYQDQAAMAQFWAKLAERFAEANPDSALGSSFPPFYEAHQRPLESDAGGGAQMSIGGLSVGAGYFSVHGIELRQGREFRLTDRFESEPVAIVSESLARHLWPEGGAIGRRLRAVEDSVPDLPPGPWRTVVGIARDVRQTYDDHDPRDVYFPFLQAPTRFGNLQLRTDRGGAPASEVAAIAAEFDPFARVGEPRMLATIDQQFARARFMTALLGGFAAFGIALALLGLHGVTAYAVQQREREVAIRAALGATNRMVVRMFLRDGGGVIVAGIALGLLGTTVGGHMLESQIHGVRPFDLATVCAAGAFIAAAGLLATWAPARRVAQKSVLAVLKEE